jgi:hypothetical protein
MIQKARNYETRQENALRDEIHQGDGIQDEKTLHHEEKCERQPIKGQQLTMAIMSVSAVVYGLNSHARWIDAEHQIHCKLDAIKEYER